MVCSKCNRKNLPFAIICKYCGSFMEPMSKNEEKIESNNDPIQDIIKIIKDVRKEKTSKVTVFIVSFLLFVFTGILKEPLSGIIILIIVLLIHEFGHILAMKIFKYYDTKLIFIPFFGAAASGKPIKYNSKDDSIITISGPLLGILFGLILFLVSGNNVFIQKIAYTSFLLNVFNLLPIYPLDGGRFIYDVLIRRNIILEMIYLVIATILLLIISYYLNIYALSFISLIIIFQIINRLKNNRVINILKKNKFEISNDSIESADVANIIPIIKTILEINKNENTTANTLSDFLVLVFLISRSSLF